MRPRILYLSYTGLMEPLGRSQILAYLSRLSTDFAITLITFEKKIDLYNEKEKLILQKKCDQHGITWLPHPYHKRPRMLATSWDLLILLWETWQHSRRNRACLIHCRSYIPAISAWLIGKLTNTPFVFDMRALWLEEMVDARTLRRSSFTFKILSWMEQRLLRNAATVVSLTKAATSYLKQKYPETKNQNYVVIPTCVDLQRFHARTTTPEHLTVGSMGTITSGWYHLDWLFKLYGHTIKKSPNALLKIVTRDDFSGIQRAAQAAGIPLERIKLDRAKPDEVAFKISDMSFGTLFFTAGPSKLGSAPTRMGEFLACGIPIIGNRGVGDMAELIEHYDVGVVIEDDSDIAISKGLSKIMHLIKSSEISNRCRSAAEDYFSVDRGANSYASMYNQIIKAKGNNR